MTDSKIFCNTPWYEIHIYWDGGLGICCQEAHRLYQGSDYNIAKVSLQQWFNAEPVQQLRQAVLGSKPVTACDRCYREEHLGGVSRRIRSNQKSAIFQQAFDASFAQSPGRKHFDPSGLTDSQPIDLHVDLGNFCNLACKMCTPQASSRIASQQVQWGIETSRQYLGTDWTRDSAVWQSFLQQLLEIPALNNIHLMGGETLLTDRFEQLVDWMLQHGRTDIGFSFVTNGTVFRPTLLEKLSKFRRVGIEVSIETVDQRNAYQRQGTDTAQVLANLAQYQHHCNGSNITVSLRPAISLLTVGSFADLLRYALHHKLVVKSLMVNTPEFLQVSVLPDLVKQQYLLTYQTLLAELAQWYAGPDINASDPNNYRQIVKQQVQLCVQALNQPAPANQTELQQQLVDHCRRWDQIYGLDARSIYPELQDLWNCYEY